MGNEVVYGAGRTDVIKYEISVNTNPLSSNYSFQNPNGYHLSSNYPNPFNAITSFDFSLPENQFVKIKVYDILGNEIIVLLNNNVGVGWSVGEDFTGTQSTFIGGEAARQATSADRCTALGYNAMGEGVTTGEGNTVLGAYAGKVLTSGNKNTFIGWLAGSTTTTGSKNLCIGHSCTNQSVGAGSQIGIGNEITTITNNHVKIGVGGNNVSTLFAGGSSWSWTSDERLKKNINTYTLGLTFINK